MLNGKGASTISIQSSVHIFDEIVKSQRLTDILFRSCKIKKKKSSPTSSCRPRAFSRKFALCKYAMG